MKKDIEISLGNAFLILIAGIFIGIFGICIPAQPFGTVFVLWSVLFLIIAPVYGILKTKGNVDKEEEIV